MYLVAMVMDMAMFTGTTGPLASPMRSLLLLLQLGGLVAGIAGQQLYTPSTLSTSTPTLSSTSTPTSTLSSTPACRYGACPVPELNPPEADDPLIVTEEVTSTTLLVTNRINTLTVAAPVWTDTTTLLLRTTLTSTEVALSTITTTTTHTALVTETLFVTRPLIDEQVELVYTTGITTVGPYTDPTTRTSTVIFTSYSLTTQTTNFTSVSKSTITAVTTSIQFIYVRITSFSLVTINNIISTNAADTTVTVRVTVLPTNIDQTYGLTTETSTLVATRIIFETTSFIPFTFYTATAPLYQALPFSANFTQPITYAGADFGTVFVYTPALTTLIT